MRTDTSGRDYDVLLYGAGGFTGRQTVAYFAAHAPTGLRWAIAGPRRQTLEAARAAAGARLPDGDLIVAPSQDRAAVDAIVSRSRIVLSTAGPFSRYGTPVVDACVRFGTHYVDITGETPWMRDIADQYHERAAADGTRIVPCCGFDSVPSDLGALLMARHIRDTMGVACAEVRAYFRFSGGLNGGTVASLFAMLDAPRGSDAAASATREDGGTIRAIGAPQHDRQFGAWIGPFVMAPTNTAVVRRSVRLAEEFGEPYGTHFVYQEAVRYDAPLGRAKAAAASLGLALVFAVLRHPSTRRLVRPVLPKPGAGPSVKSMNAGWFTCDLIAIAEDGRRARGLIRFDGDPGNRATTTFVCESALALAVDGEALPGGAARGGVLTPATALGGVLAARLRAAGTIVDIPCR
jgi:short subunit dehydrogenase-like uncharacterized protein